MPEVRPATADDLPAIGALLAAAFADDPVWTWMTGPRSDWTPRATDWFSREAGAKLRGHAEVLVDDTCRGAAIWAPPTAGAPPPVRRSPSPSRRCASSVDGPCRA